MVDRRRTILGGGREIKINGKEFLKITQIKWKELFSEKTARALSF